MKIDRIDVLNGFILKGISISGRVEKGCISNNDEFVVSRDGKEVLKTITRILSVDELKELGAFNDEVYTGEYVTFYLPDMKKEAVEEGDIVRAEHITCDPKKTR